MSGSESNQKGPDPTKKVGIRIRNTACMYNKIRPIPTVLLFNRFSEYYETGKYLFYEMKLFEYQRNETKIDEILRNKTKLDKM
jgi:hypothetical protein